MKVETDTTTEKILAAVRAIEPKVAGTLVQMDAERRMPDSIMREMMASGVFRMAIPKAYGGYELDPIAQVRVVEECSRIDGSLGWIAMIGMSGGFQAAFLDPGPAQKYFGDETSISAGQVSFTGQKAEVVDGGYRLSGRFRFASGITHANVLSCGVTLQKDGQPVLNPATNMPRMRIVMLPKSKAKVIETWDTTGMRGTGSNDFVVEDVFIPGEDSYSPADGPKLKTPLYSYAPLFLICHVGVPLGIARGVLDEVRTFCRTKVLPLTNQALQDDAAVQELVGRAETELAAARSHTYAVTRELWSILCSGRLPNAQERSEYRAMIVYAHHVAKDVVDKVVEIAATSAVVKNSVFDRALRDVTTASQHRQCNTRLYRTVGRGYLGLDLGDPSF